RHERAGRVMLAMGEVEILRAEAERAGDDVTRWRAARDAAHAVQRMLSDAPDEQTRNRVTALEAAIAAARAQIALKPESFYAHFALAKALHERGMLESAIAEYRKAIRLKPDSPDAHYSLGIALKDQGKWENAIAEYREALRLKPNYPEAHNNLGV